MGSATSLSHSSTTPMAAPLDIYPSAAVPDRSDSWAGSIEGETLIGKVIASSMKSECLLP